MHNLELSEQSNLWMFGDSSFLPLRQLRERFARLFDQLVVPSVVKIVARVGWPCRYSDLGVALRGIEESTWEALTACRDDYIDCPQES